MELKEQLKKALSELRKDKERKFDQTLDLIINLQKFDPKKNSINLFVQVPHKVKDKTEMTLTFKDEAFEKNTADKVAEHSKTFKIYFRDDTEEKGEEEDGDAKDDEKAPDFVENKSTFFGPLQKLIKKGWRALGNLW